MQNPSASALFLALLLAATPAYSAGPDGQGDDISTKKAANPIQTGAKLVGAEASGDGGKGLGPTGGTDAEKKKKLAAQAQQTAVFSQCEELGLTGDACQPLLAENPPSNEDPGDNSSVERNRSTRSVARRSDSSNTPTGDDSGGVVTNAPFNETIVTETRRQEPTVLSKNPNAAPKLATHYIGAGSPQDAERVANAALKTDPKNVDVLEVRARARALSGNVDGAVADAKTVLKAKPDSQIAHLIVGNRDILARKARGIAQPQTGWGELPDRGDGEADYAANNGSFVEKAQYAAVGLPLAAGARGAADAQALLTRRPLSPHAQQLFDSARNKLGLGDLSGAFIDATRASDMAKDVAAPLVLRAHISNRRGQNKAAIADATQALYIEPQSAAALRERAYGSIQLALYQSALDDLEQALRLEPQSGTGHFYRAMAFEKLGRVNEALADYAKAAELDPGLAPAYSDAQARLAPGGFSPLPSPSRKWAFRGGAIAASVALLIAGLIGSAKGRQLATTARKHLWDTPASRAAATIVPNAELTSGAVVGGNIRVIRELGRGGMGVVYEGFDETLQRRVALKRLQRDQNTTHEDFARFLLEARTVARLRHPRLAEIFTVLEDADVYLVFEFVEGESLDRVLNRRGRLSLMETRRALVDIASAVGYAHTQKIIHKDLKPANVVLEPSGGCKVMDFGIAHHSVSNATQLTRTSASGTPPYMSPEQAMGSVSKSSDLYALGVMSYELLTGRRPFAGPDFLEQKLNRVFAAPSTIDPALPRGLDDFFRSALEPDPTKRPKSADDFIALLDRASV